jgi:hypothetical protein
LAGRLNRNLALRHGPTCRRLPRRGLDIIAKLPSSYSRDLQLLKPPLFRGIDLAERELGTRIAGFAAACAAVRRALG